MKLVLKRDKIMLNSGKLIFRSHSSQGHTDKAVDKIRSHSNMWTHCHNKYSLVWSSWVSVYDKFYTDILQSRFTNIIPIIITLHFNKMWLCEFTKIPWTIGFSKRKWQRIQFCFSVTLIRISSKICSQYYQTKLDYPLKNE